MAAPSQVILMDVSKLSLNFFVVSISLFILSSSKPKADTLLRISHLHNSNNQKYSFVFLINDEGQAQTPPCNYLASSTRMASITDL